MPAITTICGFILACLAVSAHSFTHFRLRDTLSQCPEDASSKLNNCLIILTNASINNCGSAKVARECTRNIIQACMNNAAISRILSNYNLAVIIENYNRACGDQ